MKLSNIYSIALYESRTLFRSWFFRIFAILSLLMLFGINMGFFGAHSDALWTYRAIEANLPYFNVLFMNVAQAIIAVFLASDFLKRDKKLDTSEVIYARPITNGEYVVGKTLGILFMFVGLVVVSLLMVLIFNIIRKDTPISWIAYLYYPLLITVPTLIFILGLSFFMMILFRSQAVTFLVLLGYIVLTLAYFQDKAYGMLDYMAFNMPMVYSDFIGFANPERILFHRMAYLFLGTGFIFATIRFLNRLPQTGRWNFLNTLFFAIFLLAGIGSGWIYYSNFRDTAQKRERYLELNNQWVGTGVVDVLTENLDVVQKGTSLQVRASISYQNENSGPLDTLVFSLNPGFRVDSINGSHGTLSYIQEEQIILVIPDRPLESGGRGRAFFSYSGTPEASLAYLDIPREKVEELKKAIVATFDKEPGIIHPDYMLLTPELNWYPRAGVGFNLENFQPSEPDFVSFELNVKAAKGLTAVAPGRVDTVDGGLRFRPEKDLNALPLVLAPLERRSMEIDGLEYNLYLDPDHDYFSSYFSEIKDTIRNLIKEAQDNYEIDELDLYYPFERINLVEVPIQYHPYERPYIQTVESILPEMVLLPEKGAGLNTLDFERFKKVEERRDRDRDNKRSDREIQVDQFKRFLQSTFFRTGNRSSGLQGRRGGGEKLDTYNGDLYSINPYCVFPLYYSYITGVSSDEYPVFNAMLERYLKEGFEVDIRQSFTGGITDKERANQALKDKSMLELFARWDTELTSSLINQTGSFIIAALKNRVGQDEFDNFLYYYVEDHAFSEIRFEDFASDFQRDFGVEIAPYLDIIRSDAGMATFKISDPEFIQTRDDIGDVYIVRYRISNVGDAAGLVEMNFRVMGSSGFGGGSGPQEEKRMHEVEAGQTREIQEVLFERPMLMTVNTLISGNIPASWNVFLRSATEVEKTSMVSYEKDSDHEVSFTYEGETVVDNEDEGFTHYSVSRASKVKQWLNARQDEEEVGLKYQALNEHWSPLEWTAMAHSGYYGETVRSAMAIRKGDGSSMATWEAVLSDKAYYDLYVYIPVSALYKRPGRTNEGGGRGGQGGGPGQGGGGGGHGGRRGPEFADKGADYHYTIQSSSGTQEQVMELNRPEDGWNLLGSFHLPADTVRISLSNETDGKRVIADAIKLVKR